MRDEERSAWRDGQGRALTRFKPPAGALVRHTKVVLATAHLDHEQLVEESQGPLPAVPYAPVATVDARTPAASHG